MSKTRFTIIDIGRWDVPRNEIIAAETPEIFAENRRHTISGFAVLIQNDTLGNVLYDTGISADWNETWPAQFKKDYSFHYHNRLDEKLKELDLTVDDIDLLIVSHLHYDHAGNIKLFKNTKAGQKIIISKDEAHEAIVNCCISPDGLSGAYFRPEIVMDGIGYQLIDQDMTLAEGVMLFLQEGHTPAVIGMILQTEKDGNFIVTSDAVYSSYNFGPPIILPGCCVAPDAYKANIVRVLELQQKYDAQIFFSHDVDNFATYKKSPEFYE